MVKRLFPGEWTRQSLAISKVIRQIVTVLRQFQTYDVNHTKTHLQELGLDFGTIETHYIH